MKPISTTPLTSGTPEHLTLRGSISPARSTRRRARPAFAYFILWGVLLCTSLMAAGTAMFCFVFAPDQSFFYNLAAAMIVSWTQILTIYYVWAIYFYNISSALPRLKNSSLKNPHAEETLGLPAGTVRGTIALSVLVIAMAMMIASLAMPATVKESELMTDHFEFLKTGFIMVIAFYFGTKSLEILKNKVAQ